MRAEANHDKHCRHVKLFSEDRQFSCLVNKASTLFKQTNSQSPNTPPQKKTTTICWQNLFSLFPFLTCLFLSRRQLICGQSHFHFCGRRIQSENSSVKKQIQLKILNVCIKSQLWKVYDFLCWTVENQLNDRPVCFCLRYCSVSFCETERQKLSAIDNFWVTLWHCLPRKIFSETRGLVESKNLHSFRFVSENICQISLNFHVTVWFRNSQFQIVSVLFFSQKDTPQTKANWSAIQVVLYINSQLKFFVFDRHPRRDWWSNKAAKRRRQENSGPSK